MTKLNRSIARGIAVLEVIHASGPSSLSLLAARTGLSKPTLLRICATLESRRWLTRRSSDGCYQVGSGFPRTGGVPDRVDRLVAVAKEAIVALSEETGMAVDLAAAIGGGRLEIVDTTRIFRRHGVYPDAVGFRPSPVFSALGLAYLAALSADERAEVLHGLVDRLPRDEAAALAQLPALLRASSRRGYTIRAAGHWGRAVDYGALPAAIALPILAGGAPVGALNLVWKASDHTVEAIGRAYVAPLRSAAETIGARYAAAG